MSRIDLYYTQDPRNQPEQAHQAPHDFDTGPFFGSIDSPVKTSADSFVISSKHLSRVLSCYGFFKSLVLEDTPPSNWHSSPLWLLGASAKSHRTGLDLVDRLNSHLRTARRDIFGLREFYFGNGGGDARAVTAFLHSVPPLSDESKWQQRLEGLAIVRIEQERDECLAKWEPLLAAVDKMEAVGVPKNYTPVQWEELRSPRTVRTPPTPPPLPLPTAPSTISPSKPSNDSPFSSSCAARSSPINPPTCFSDLSATESKQLQHSVEEHLQVWVNSNRDSSKGDNINGERERSEDGENGSDFESQPIELFDPPFVAAPPSSIPRLNTSPSSHPTLRRRVVR